MKQLYIVIYSNDGSKVEATPITNRQSAVLSGDELVGHTAYITIAEGALDAIGQAAVNHYGGAVVSDPVDIQPK